MTQSERIIAYLREFGSITQYDAMRELGIMRLASRISDLRKHGYDIRKEMIKVNTRYDGTTAVAQYRLVEAQND